MRITKAAVGVVFGIMLVVGGAVADSNEVVGINIEQQYERVNPGGESALAIRFKLKEDWHFYASEKTAPGQMHLKVKASSGDLVFSELIFPEWQMYFDKSSNQRLEVFSGEFTVYLPFKVKQFESLPAEGAKAAVKVFVEGAVCSDILCRLERYELDAEVAIVGEKELGEATFELPAGGAAEPVKRFDMMYYSSPIVLLLAILAGLMLNIMPCVWPVIPLIVMRILAQSKESRAKSISMGLAFCLGIVLFFGALAVVNIVLRVGYGTVFQWGDHFRNTGFVLGMSLLMVVLALYMFGAITIGIPLSISSKGGAGRGYASSVGMGFLAAVLSTPCSFAIIATVFVWAQTQRLGPATAAIMLMGVGMSIPYLILTSIPGLLGRLPKPGRWMEIFKQATGFVLLMIAIKLLEALPGTRLIGVLYFAVILSFCVWMWGGWVSFSTAFVRKWMIRLAAVTIAVWAGFGLLAAPGEELIAWQEYDAARIEKTVGAGRPVLIEFMADWCLTCKAVEKTVYAKKEIADLIAEKNILAVRGDTTVWDSAATIDLKEVYREPGVPVSILFVPGQDEPLRFRGLLIGGDLKKALRELP